MYYTIVSQVATSEDVNTAIDDMEMLLGMTGSQGYPIDWQRTSFAYFLSMAAAEL